VVKGIHLITAVWSDGDRVYHTAGDGKTKNDHFADLLAAAHARGVRPAAVLFDGWYASTDNLKRVRQFGWVFVTRLKGNRKVRLDHGAATAVADQPIAAGGAVVWLPEFGLARVFRVVARNGDTTHWATNDLGMDESARLVFAESSWGVEEYHRGLKQFTGVDGCQARAARAAEPHRVCHPRVRAVGAPPVHHRRQLVRRQSRHHPRRRPRLPRQPTAHPLRGNCVTRIVMRA
jgi:putative transposase